MKVDDRVSNYLSLLNSSTQPSAAQPGETGSKPNNDTPPVEVNLSTDAAQLADDEARRLRLNAIRQQLAEGSYNISGKDVANKILNVLKADVGPTTK